MGVSPSNPERKIVNVRAGKDQVVRWKAAAERDARSLSSWIRAVLDRAAR